MADPTLTARDGSFYLHERPAFLLSGEFHYFRVPPSLWDASLAKLKALRFNAISSYIPWSWHEPDEGRTDFDGATHPQRNVVHFLEIVRRHGLVFHARPGPFIYAEFLGLGLPRWLARAHPEAIARRPDGALVAERRWETASLLHPVYQQLVRRWFEAVATMLRPFWHDPVVTFQLDNETGLLYAHRLGEIDFNPQTVDLYQRFLARHYGDIARLNERWQTHYASFENILPPRRPFRHAEALDYQRFLERWIADYLAFLKVTARTVGVPVPLTHNEQTTHHSPAHVALKRTQVEWTGYDVYLKMSSAKEPADFPFANTIYPSIFSGWTDTAHPLWAAELGMGWFDRRARVGNDTVLQAVMGSVAHGAAGINCYIAHDGRDPDGALYAYPSILDVHGEPTPRAQLMQRLAPWLHESHDLLRTSQETFDPIGFAYYYPNNRVTTAEFLCGQDGLDPLHYLIFLAHQGLFALLTTAGFAPQMVHIETAPLATLLKYRLLICPSKGYLDAATAEKLQQYVESGGDLLFFPEWPRRTWENDPLPLAKLIPARRETRQLLGDSRLKWRLMWEWAGLFQCWTKRRLARRQPDAMHVIELVEPLLVAFKERPGTCELETSSGLRCQGDYVAWSFLVNPFAEALLKTPDGCIAGFRAPVGRGRCAVLGTCLGGSYVTPWYYRWSVEQRRRLRDAATWLAHESGIERRFDTELECQIVTRRLANGCSWLFFINRLGAQSGTVRLRPLEEFGITGQARRVFSGNDSTVDAFAPGEFRVSLAPQDVLVVEVR